MTVHDHEMAVNFIEMSACRFEMQSEYNVLTFKCIEMNWNDNGIECNVIEMHGDEIELRCDDNAMPMKYQWHDNGLTIIC